MDRKERALAAVAALKEEYPEALLGLKNKK